MAVMLIAFTLETAGSERSNSGCPGAVENVQDVLEVMIAAGVFYRGQWKNGPL